MTFPENLGKVLDRNLADLGLGAKAQRYQVYLLWQSIVGDMARYAKPRRVDGDSLIVATASSVWAQELTFMGDDILKRVNSALGAIYFREIHFSERQWRSTARQDTFREGYHRRVLGQERRAARGAPGTPEETFLRLRKTMEARVARLRAEGFEVCPRCGHMFRRENHCCPLCQWRTESEGYHRAMAVLEKTPEVSDEEVMESSGIRSKVAVERARSELESRWMALVWTYLGGEVKRVRPDRVIRDAASKLFSLRSGKKADGLNAKQIIRILGPKIAPLVGKGRPAR